MQSLCKKMTFKSPSSSLVNNGREIIDHVLRGISVSGRRSPPASKADRENGVDAPELPFFFPDKDSICHQAICSLRVRISMISNHSTTLCSPWCHLYTHLSADTTDPIDCHRTLIQLSGIYEAQEQ